MFNIKISQLKKNYSSSHFSLLSLELLTIIIKKQCQLIIKIDSITVINNLYIIYLLLQLLFNILCNLSLN